MPCYQIYRLKEGQRENFRWQPHTPGASTLKAKDYERDEMVEAISEYAAWMRLREDGRPLRVGDLLEIDGVSLRICKYIGFEEAAWHVPEGVAASRTADGVAAT